MSPALGEGNVLSTDQDPLGGGSTTASGYDYGEVANNSVYRTSGFTATITDSYSGPESGPDGVTWDGSDSRLTDGTFNPRLYRMSGFSGTVQESVSIGFEVTRQTCDENGNLIGFNRDDTAWFKASGYSSTVTDSFSYSNAGQGAGVTWNGTHLFTIADPDSSSSTPNNYLKHSGFSVSVTDSFSFSNGVQQLTIDGSGNIYTTNDQDPGDTFKMSGFSSTIADSHVTDPGATDGMDLSDFSARTGGDGGGGGGSGGAYFQHSGFTNTVQDSFSSPGDTPTGITWTGADVIAADDATDTYYRHSSFTSTVKDSFSAGTTKPLGVTWQ